MLMTQDLAYTAFEAAQGRDQEAMHDVVAELILRGPYEIDTAFQAWIDRTIVVIGHTSGKIRMKVAMIPDNSGTGEADPLKQVRQPDVSWAGHMFLAHVSRDKAAWARLWAQVPAGQLIRYVERMLTTMAYTALAYQEGMNPDDEQEGDHQAPELACTDPVHKWIAANRWAVCQQVGKAHLN